MKKFKRMEKIEIVARKLKHGVIHGFASRPEYYLYHKRIRTVPELLTFIRDFSEDDYELLAILDMKALSRGIIKGHTTACSHIEFFTVGERKFAVIAYDDGEDVGCHFYPRIFDCKTFLTYDALIKGVGEYYEYTKKYIVEKCKEIIREEED